MYFRTPQLASTGLFTDCVPAPCSLGCSSVGLYEVDSTKQTEVVVQIDSCSLDQVVVLLVPSYLRLARNCAALIQIINVYHCILAYLY